MLVSASSPFLRGRSTKVRAIPRIRRADFIIDVDDKASILTRPSHETSAAEAGRRAIRMSGNTSGGRERPCWRRCGDTHQRRNTSADGDLPAEGFRVLFQERLRLIQRTQTESQTEWTQCKARFQGHRRQRELIWRH